VVSGSGDPQKDLAELWAGWFADVPRYSTAVFATFDDDTGQLADRAAFDEVVNEIGTAGKTAWVLISWALVLAATHAPSDEVLAPYISTIGQEQWRDPVHRHGRGLINTARVAAGNPDGPRLLIDRSRRISAALGNDIWWLIWVMAAATHPVQRDCGGWDRFGEITSLVNTSLLDTTAVAPATTVAAGLAAINAGNLDRARACLGLLDVPELLTVLIPLVRRLLSGPAVKLVLELDVDGMPVSLGDPEPGSPAIALTRDLINAVLALDRSRLATVRAAIFAAGRDEQVLMTWYLALTLGHHLPR
jgi:hypothetical protein